MKLMINRWSLSPALALALTQFSGWAAGQNNVEPTLEIQDEAEKPEVTVKSSGKIVIVGPDGKKQEFEFGDRDLKFEVPQGAWDLVHKLDEHGAFELSKLFLKNRDELWDVVKEKLEDSGLDEKAMEAVREAVAEAVKESPHAAKAMKLLDRAFLVGPEGERDVKMFFQELGAGLRGNELEGEFWQRMTDVLRDAGVTDEQLEKAEQIWKDKQSPSKYRIGVRCAEVSPALQAQLPLEGEGGLLVEELFATLPAKAAGIQAYDVLIKANGKHLQSIDHLVEEVQESGRANEPVQLEVLRRGEVMTIEVVPAKQEVEPAVDSLKWLPDHGKGGPHEHGVLGALRLDQGPKPKKDDERAVESLEDQIANLRDTIESLKAKIDEHGEASAKAAEDHATDAEEEAVKEAIETEAPKEDQNGEGNTSK